MTFLAGISPDDIPPAMSCGKNRVSSGKVSPTVTHYDPEHPKHMTYDDHVAHFVRLIFSWALEGVGSHTIAMRLRELDAPTQERIEYLRSGGRTCHEGTSLWSAASVPADPYQPNLYRGFVCGKRYNALCDPYNRRPVSRKKNGSSSRIPIRPIYQKRTFPGFRTA